MSQPSGITEGFWQEILPAEAAPCGPPYTAGYPARLPDGRVLLLPIRPLPEPGRAVASLIANQASLKVADALAGFMAHDAAGAEVIVAMPTLGLVFAPLMAHRLGHPNYVPLGYSRKFWYDDALGEPVSSVTTPGAGKRVYLDPNLLPRLEGKRAVLVDDAISSGATAAAALSLLNRAGCQPAAIAVAMAQGMRWRERLGAAAASVRPVFASPLLRRTATGWEPEPGTLHTLTRHKPI